MGTAGEWVIVSIVSLVHETPAGSLPGGFRYPRGKRNEWCSGHDIKMLPQVPQAPQVPRPARRALVYSLPGPADHSVTRRGGPGAACVR